MSGGTCAIILAGGRGTRISAQYPHLPKPLVPAGGCPFVEWVIRQLATSDVDRFVVSLGHLAELAEEYFDRRTDDGLRISTVRETQPLGTAGGMLLAYDEAGEGADRVLVANGDSLVLADLSDAWRSLAEEDIDGVVVGVDVDDAGRFGTLAVDARQMLHGFREKQPGRGLINAGVYLFRAELFRGLSRGEALSMETDVFPRFLGEGARLRVHACRAPFLDIGTPESVVEADRFVRRHFEVKSCA